MKFELIIEMDRKSCDRCPLWAIADGSGDIVAGDHYCTVTCEDVKDNVDNDTCHERCKLKEVK